MPNFGGKRLDKSTASAAEIRHVPISLAHYRH